MCVCPSTAGGIGTSAATRCAPQIQALVHRAAARAGGEVKLCSPRLAPGREAERVARHELVPVRTSAADDPGQLLAAGGQDSLDVALDDASGDPQVPGDLIAGEPVAVEHRDPALALVEALEDRERELVQLGSFLALDQDLVRRRQRWVDGLKLLGGVVDEDLSLEAIAHVVDRRVGRLQQPLVDLAHRLPAARPAGFQARLLKGLLDLLARGAALDRGDLPSQLGATAPARDLREQCSGSLGARRNANVDRHATTRGRGDDFGPHLFNRGQIADTRPVRGLDTHRVEPPAPHVRSGTTLGSWIIGRPSVADSSATD